MHRRWSDPSGPPAQRSTGRFAAAAAVVVLVWGGGTGAQPFAPPAPQADGHFRTSADLVVVDAVVTAGEAFVPGLTAGDFLVLDDGTPQPVSAFLDERGVPASITLLLDRSGSMAGARLEAAKTAAVSFLDALGPDDRVEVLAFNARVTELLPSTPGHAADPGPIERLKANGTTGWHDAVLVALQNLERSNRVPGEEQRVIVLFTDGEDTSSTVDFDEVLDAVRRSGVTLYTVSLRSDRKGPALPPTYELSQLAHASGGRAIAVQSASDLPGVYRAVGEELRHFYRIGFLPEPMHRDGRWHTLSVRVPERDVHVRARAGYVAATCAATESGAEGASAEESCPSASSR